MKFIEYLMEGYTKKTVISKQKEISQELYDIIQNSKQAEQYIGRVSTNKMKPNMFKIELYNGGTGEDWTLPPNKGTRKGRKPSKIYEYISLYYSDWFNGDTVRRNFPTAKSFNNFLDTMRGFK